MCQSDQRVFDLFSCAFLTYGSMNYLQTAYDHGLALFDMSQWNLDQSCVWEYTATESHQSDSWFWITGGVLFRLRQKHVGKKRLTNNICEGKCFFRILAFTVVYDIIKLLFELFGGD